MNGKKCQVPRICNKNDYTLLKQGTSECYWPFHEEVDGVPMCWVHATAKRAGIRDRVLTSSARRGMLGSGPGRSAPGKAPRR